MYRNSLQFSFWADLSLFADNRPSNNDCIRRPWGVCASRKFPFPFATRKFVRQSDSALHTLRTAITTLPTFKARSYVVRIMCPVSNMLLYGMCAMVWMDKNLTGGSTHAMNFRIYKRGCIGERRSRGWRTTVTSVGFAMRWEGCHNAFHVRWSDAIEMKRPPCFA